MAPGIRELFRNWRYELGLSAGLAAVALASGYALGAVWLIALAATGLVVLAAGLAWPPSRRRLIARAWCMLTPHRIRAGCRHAWVQTRDGTLPVILYTMTTAFGERVTMWCPAGITYGDLEAARGALRAACWAADVRVVASPRYPRVVVLEVIRHRAAAPPGRAMLPCPYLDRGLSAHDADHGKHAVYGGAGHHWPFGP
jgi:hypothetical protein